MPGADAADLPGAFHELLSTFIPYPVFRVLVGFSNLIYSLLGSSNDPASWTSTLLPPLITFFLAYAALVIAYRTVRNAISLAWWGIKWGAIIGAAIAMWAWWTDNTEAINSVEHAPPSGWFDQIGRLNSFVSNPAFSAIYSQLSNSGAASSNSRARRSTPFSGRDRKPRNRRNARSNGGIDIDDNLPADLSGGLGAFSDLLGRTQNEGRHNNDNSDGHKDGGGGGGVDFAGLLGSMISAGQRQGIDAASALRAAGRVQDEMRKFQENPTAWLDSIGASFRTGAGGSGDGGIGAGERDEEPIGLGTRGRARQGRAAAR